IPLTLLTYIISRSFRPERTWTLRQAIGVRVFRSIIDVISALRVRTPLPLDAGEEGERFVKIPFKEEWKQSFKGPLKTENVQPEKALGATWYTSTTTSTPTPTTTKPLTILHIHGGAFVVGDGRSKATSFLSHTLLRPFPPKTQLLAPQYRLSTLPPSTSPSSNPFPAALQDALTSYLYLTTTLSIAPSDIILSGDSAGGNLVIALLRYLAEYGDEIGVKGPAAALIWSPWVDPTAAGVQTNSHAAILKNRNFTSDILPVSFLEWGRVAYTSSPSPSSSTSSSSPSYAEAVKEQPPPTQNPYINHKISPFSTPTPLWVSVGGREVLCDDGIEWSEAMRKVKGNRVTVDVEEMAPHDVLLLGRELGFERVAGEVAGRAGRWVGEV
ncbi:alpha/beta-hydrolase, partial [Periconia macrospinosa]